VDALHPERSLQIGAKLLANKKVCFKEFLFNNLDVFAWSPIDMPGIDPAIIYHWLAIDPKVKLVKQKPGKMNVKRGQALSDEVDQLLCANFIWETH